MLKFLSIIILCLFMLSLFSFRMAFQTIADINRFDNELATKDVSMTNNYRSKNHDNEMATKYVSIMNNHRSKKQAITDINRFDNEMATKNVSITNKHRSKKQTITDINRSNNNKVTKNVSITKKYRSKKETITDINRSNNKKVTKKDVSKMNNYRSKKEANKKKLPLMFIHIGPAKTATTGLQHFLFEYKDELRKKDSYASLIRGHSETLRKFTNVLVLFPTCSIEGSDLPSDLNITSRGEIPSGMNLIMSEEELGWSRFGSQCWKDFLSYYKSYYRINFVMYYRRYFEWFLSYYNQVNTKQIIIFCIVPYLEKTKFTFFPF